ncbi:MAG TPA: FAD-binding protein [Jiangellaceae bacterium]
MTITATPADLRDRLSGDLIAPTDDRYDEARRLYNGMFDKRPLMIARCANVADVITAIGYGRKHDLPIAVRGDGHNGAGLTSCDDGLVIDLSAMTGVRVDPDRQTV